MNRLSVGLWGINQAILFNVLIPCFTVDTNLRVRLKQKFQPNEDRENRTSTRPISANANNYFQADQRVRNMTTSIAIFAGILLILVTAVSLETSHCGNDLRLTPADDVLFGADTPVYWFHGSASSEFGHTLRKNDYVMSELKKTLPVNPESANGKTSIEDKCNETPSKWYQKDVLGTLECKAPDTIYPKIVIIVDYPMYQHYGNTTNLIKFLMAYWNGVDVLFRTLEHPKLRFHIAGIIIAQKPDVLPFFSENKKSDMYDSSTTPAALGRFMETKGASWSSFFGDYHIAAAMTTKTLFKMEDKECKRDDYHSTMEFSRDMCTDVKNKGPPARVVISVDGHWMKMRRTAKMIEIALKPWGLNGNESTCPYQGNAVTQHTSFMANKYPDWSDCYLNSFKKRFNNAKANCFFRKPKVTSPLPRLQLGRIYPGQNQCTEMKMGEFCINENICHNLQCKDTETKSCKSASIPAADGTICGPKKICYRRECKLEEDV